MISNEMLQEQGPFRMTLLVIQSSLFQEVNYQVPFRMTYSQHTFRLCHTMTCFCEISCTQISIGYYTCGALLFFVAITLCTLLLCSMTHYDITMGNDIARDAHCDITMSNDIVMHTSQCIIMLL